MSELIIHNTMEEVEDTNPCEPPCKEHYWVHADYPEQSREMWCLDENECQEYVEELKSRPGLTKVVISKYKLERTTEFVPQNFQSEFNKKYDVHFGLATCRECGKHLWNELSEGYFTANFSNGLFCSLACLHNYAREMEKGNRIDMREALKKVL